MEVRLRQSNTQNQSNNLNNVRVANKVQEPHKNHSNANIKSTKAGVHGHEFQESISDKQNSEGPSEEETRQQTVKILTEFFRGVASIAENSQRDSQNRSGMKSVNLSPDNINKAPSTSGRRKQVSQILPLRQESNDEKLSRVMSGRTRQQSDVSLASSDSTDSVMRESFNRKRNKSFSKAQRHSVVTEFESKTLTEVTSRRSSEDIPQMQPLYPETTVQGSYNDATDSKSAGSPISHYRASSDSAVANFDVTGKHQRHKEKKNKNKVSKFFRIKKKKDGNKSKASIKESNLEADGFYSTQQNQREGRKSEKKTLAREDSSLSKRRSPSPPSAGTPKFLRRFSNKFHKSDKREPQSQREKSISEKTETRRHRESSKNTSRSKSLEFDSVEPDGVHSNGDAKSNSLPMETRFSTKPPTGADSEKHLSSDVKHKEAVRPNTLDIPKKKSKSTFEKFSKYFPWHSSSSSSSESDDDDDVSQTQDRQVRSLPAECIRHSIRNANSNKEITVTERKEMYQHRATKSMSDVDPLDKNCKEIARRLKIVANKSVLSYRESDRRSQTPDSYRHQMKKKMKPGRKPQHHEQIGRASSLKTPSTAKVQSQSLKAYYNMQPRKNSETQLRITRDEVDHGRPSADAPRHFPGTNNSSTWLDKDCGRERGVGHSTFDSHESNSTTLQNGHHVTHSSSSRTYRYHKDSHNHGAPPAPKLSSSPSLPRASSRSPNRVHGPSLDEMHHRRHIEQNIDITTTATSPRGTRRLHAHYDVVSDAVVSDGSDVDDSFETGLCGDDFARGMMGPEDTEVVEERREEITVTEETDNCSAPSPRAPLLRQRAATTPEMPNDFNDLDGDDEDDEELGAVGGQDTEDMEKLADEITRVLRNRADKLNEELVPPQFEEAIQSKLKQFSEEKVKEICSRVASKISTASRNHSGVLEIALLFDMAGLFFQITRQAESKVRELFTGPITSLVQGMGGWSTVQSSLDCTEMEDGSLESEEPGTSGLNNNHRRPSRRRESNSSNSDLD